MLHTEEHLGGATLWSRRSSAGPCGLARTHEGGEPAMGGLEARHGDVGMIGTTAALQTVAPRGRSAGERTPGGEEDEVGQGVQSREGGRASSSASSFNAFPSKDAREHAHMFPTALVQCSSGTKQSSRGIARAGRGS